MDVKEAVFWLLDFAGYRRIQDTTENPILKYQVPYKEVEKKTFVLPQPAHSNAYLYEYLTNDRAISLDVVNFFVNQGLIYESLPYHNIVFKGNDKDGVTRFASMRGVFDKQGKPFKCDVAGNDKRYGFNIANEESTELVVFEAAIDMMSYMDIHRDFHSNMIALGMVADAPLETFLKEHPQIESIRFCLDNDKPGRDATEMMMENDIVNIGLHFFHKDVRPMQLPVKKYSTVVA